MAAKATVIEPAPPRDQPLDGAQSECRFCGQPLSCVFADLGMTPLANSLLGPDQVQHAERFYPLRALVCERCFLVQLEEHEPAEAIFSNYPYFSSFSSTWLEHSRRFADRAIERFELGPDSKVVEVASNDGYLLQYFKQAGIPVLGVEPAANVAKAAIERGIPTLVEFFGTTTAHGLTDRWRADLLVANNVVPHVPGLNDFVAGLKTLLAPGGVLTVELQHLMRLVERTEFDTIYHEHFCYFSLGTAQRVFAGHGIDIVDVEEIPTHGGSLRLYGRHSEAGEPMSERAAELLERERAAGFEEIETYLEFSERVRAAKRELLAFLVALKRDGLRIAGYGAPAKGNTLLNYCGIGTDFLDFTVDVSPHKQGRYLPGSHIAILHPDALREARPDVVLILPWNLRDEITEQHAYVAEWGGRFAVAVPSPTLI